MMKTLKNLFINAFPSALAIKPWGFISNIKYYDFYSLWIIFSSMLNDLQLIDQSTNLASVFLASFFQDIVKFLRNIDGFKKCCQVATLKIQPRESCLSLKAKGPSAITPLPLFGKDTVVLPCPRSSDFYHPEQLGDAKLG